jgi:peptidoglycan hydrolase-like protein with peptidoglycan-binding domain
MEMTRELQQILKRIGYDVGTIDGKLGLNTRNAVRDVQLKFGLAADGYPTQELLQQLRGVR